MEARTTFRHKVANGLTTVRKLKLTRLPDAATVKVSCKGGGCAFKNKTLRPKKSSVTLTGLFKGKQLSAGTVIKLRIKASGYEPTTIRYKTREGSKPPTGGVVSRQNPSEWPFGLFGLATD
jgi:hypothetical protein